MRKCTILTVVDRPACWSCEADVGEGCSVVWVGCPYSTHDLYSRWTRYVLNTTHHISRGRGASKRRKEVPSTQPLHYSILSRWLLINNVCAVDIGLYLLALTVAYFVAMSVLQPSTIVALLVPRNKPSIRSQ